jgi:hypothetical protein
MLKRNQALQTCMAGFACANARTVVCRGEDTSQGAMGATRMRAYDPLARSIPVEWGISTSIASVETLGPRSIRT